MPCFLRAAVLFALCASPAAAAVIRTPECQRDLAVADQLIGGIRQRETRLNAAIGRNDTTAACGFLRENARDMAGARERMYRCMTGFEQRENIGQIDASLGDIRAVLAARCK
jgi:hypothetical protein